MQFFKLVSFVLKLIPIPLFIGAFASYIYFLNFGGESLKKVFLEWTIGVTFVATIVPLVLSLFEKQKQKIEQKINK